MDLSIIIPARNEMFLAKTVENILENIEGDKTEIIVVLDGKWADPPIPVHEKVTVVYLPESVGHREATNIGARISQAEYVLKIDAHCAVGEGFDVKMMEEMKDDWTMVPLMRNLHAFDWICTFCNWRTYQRPTPKKCPHCGNKVKRDIIWKPRSSPNSMSFCFDNTLKFQYFGDFKKRPESKVNPNETLSIQGSCFMATRDKYFELNLCDETWGTWGQQGVEVACKTWLSGGKLMCNKNTWYAHLFRTQGGDFSFPYKLRGKHTKKTRKLSREIIFNNRLETQVKPFSWLLEHFWPVSGFRKGGDGKTKIPFWTEEDLQKQKEREKENWPPKKKKKELTKGIVYYTDNQLPLRIARRCQKNLLKMKLPIFSASLKPMPHFGKNVHLPLKRGYLAMFRQILAGIEVADTDIIFFAEHDVLYHPSHFDFVPPKRDRFYYNTNVWRVRENDGFAVRTDDCRQASGLCAYRDLLLDHYRKRVEMVEKMAKELDEKKFNRFIRRLGFEPGTHGRIKEFANLKSDRWESEHPNVDIRRGGAVTRSKWRPEDYRNKRFAKGWQETKDIPSWGRFKDFF